MYSTLKQIRFYRPEGEWGWLANFSEHPICIDGSTWQTVEHYFQAQKFIDSRLRLIVQNQPTAAAAKHFAKQNATSRRSDWLLVRDEVMFRGIRAKFLQHEDLRDKLLGTTPAIIVEDCDDDLYWCGGRRNAGKNRMGELLMQLRAELSDHTVDAHARRLSL